MAGWDDCGWTGAESHSSLICEAPIKKNKNKNFKGCQKVAVLLIIFLKDISVLNEETWWLLKCLSFEFGRVCNPAPEYELLFSFSEADFSVLLRFILSLLLFIVLLFCLVCKGDTKVIKLFYDFVLRTSFLNCPSNLKNKGWANKRECNSKSVSTLETTQRAQGHHLKN